MQGSMWAMSVAVLDVLLQHQLEVARGGDQPVIEAFAAQRADEAFGDIELLAKSRIRIVTSKPVPATSEPAVTAEQLSA
jgi:hypothetical protein